MTRATRVEGCGATGDTGWWVGCRGSRVEGRIWRTVVALVVVVAVHGEVRGQMFSYDVDRPEAVQSLSFGYHIVDFSHDGDAAPEETFEYSGPAYGALYTRPNVRASIAYGSDSGSPTRDLRLLDATIMTWGDLWLGGMQGGPTGFSVPIAIHTNYRRVAPRGSEDSLVDAFNVTVLGLGAGLSYTAGFAGKVQLRARALPGIGLALRSFGDSAGSAYLLDSVLDIHTIRLVSRFGLSASYRFRAQVWNVGASELLGEQLDDLFDYSGTKHVISLGINW